jgi:NAD(P)-dependent dehydrogenase (short-subunit alcohol dehydrogenase family)
VKGSLSDLADLDRLYGAVKAERGTLDIVFANAGTGSPLPLGKITAEHIDEIFDTKCEGFDLHGPEGAAADGPGRLAARVRP